MQATQRLKFYAVAAALYALAMFVAAIDARPASAHGDAAWIEEGGYKDKDGVGCCGPHDCHRSRAKFFREANEGVWVKTADGKEILMGRELARRGLYSSVDDEWWICIRGGEVKCVFKPATGG